MLGQAEWTVQYGCWPDQATSNKCVISENVQSDPTIESGEMGALCNCTNTHA